MFTRMSHELIAESPFPSPIRVAYQYSKCFMVRRFGFILMLDFCSDDCGEVRRKIRLLQKTPGWKVKCCTCRHHCIRDTYIRSTLGVPVVERNWWNQQQLIWAFQWVPSLLILRRQ